MGGLFDLPTSRSNKQSDKSAVKKSTNKKSSGIVIKGGNSLLDKITGINALVESKIGKYKDDYIYYMADDESKFKEYIYNIKQLGDCSFDTETMGLNPITDQIVGFSLYSKGQKGLYVPLHHKSYITGMEVEGQIDTRIVTEQLQLLVDAGVKFKGYNAKFDKRVAKNWLGVLIPFWFDAHLAAMCLDENEPHGLKTLHSKYVLQGKEDEFSFGKLFEGITFDLVPIKTGYIYAARDAVDTDELVDFQLPYLDKDNELCIENELQGVSNVFWNIEMPYVDVIVELEENGVSIDVDYAKVLSEKYHELLREKEQNFFDVVLNYEEDIDSYRKQHPENKLGDPINIGSPTQLAILLYDILKLPKIDGRKTGEEILSQIDHPICNAILEYRGVAKLLSTYIDKMPDLLLSDGKVHCKFNQYGAKTGRLSSEDPNMQNIPSHNKDIRKMFVASEGHVMLSADFSQQEPRCMAAMCGDETMIQAYKDEKDLYASIASLSFSKPYEECLEFYLDENGKKTEKVNKEGKERRQNAKSILLGILYGRGINSVAEQLGTTKQKAQQIQDKVFKGFPAIKKFEEDTVEMAKEVGFVTTFWGRKRRLPEMQFEEFEFSWMEGYGDEDPLCFDENTVMIDVPEAIKNKYISKLQRSYKDKPKIIEAAKADGIIIKDNGGKIADETRQCVNSRIQGSAADMSKIAGRIILDNQRLKELGFKLLIPIHDEYLAECPKENAKECAKIFSDCMCEAAKDLGLPISVDVDVSDRWYGEKMSLQ